MNSRIEETGSSRRGAFAVLAILLSTISAATPSLAQTVSEIAPLPVTAPVPDQEPSVSAAPAPDAVAPPESVVPLVLPSTAPTGTGTPVKPLRLYPHAREVAIGGAVVAGVGYLASVILGALTYAIPWSSPDGDACEGCPDIRMMFVPLVGPFVFLAQARSGNLDVVIPLGIIGGVQVIGLGVCIVAGILAAVGHYRSKHRTTAVVISPNGAHQLSLRF